MGRAAGGARCAGGAVALLALVWAAGAPTATASCAPRKPREQMVRADAAFIGHLVERDGSRLTFAIDERVKGDLGERVDVRDTGASTPLSLRPAPGVQIGLFLRGDPEAGFAANDCDVVTPEAMRAAAVSGRSTCERPRVLSFRVRHAVRRLRRVRVRVVVDDPDGRVSAVDIAWGDGADTRIATRRGGQAIVRAHRYRRAGRFRIAVVARSAPGLDCGFDEERSAVKMRAIRVR